MEAAEAEEGEEVEPTPTPVREDRAVSGPEAEVPEEETGQAGPLEPGERLALVEGPEAPRAPGVKADRLSEGRCLFDREAASGLSTDRSAAAL